jgi:hypothetical protein
VDRTPRPPAPHPRATAFFLLAFLVAGPGGSSALHAAERFGDILIAPEKVRWDPSQHGYLEYAIVVTNQSATEAHEVRLTIPKTKFRYQPNALRSLSRTVRVGPASSVRVALWQPDLPLGGDGLEVTIDGQTRQRLVTITLYQSRGTRLEPQRFGREKPFVLVSRNCPPNLEASVLRAEMPGPGPVINPPKKENPPPALPPLPVSPRDVVLLRSEIPVADWGTNWLSYSGYDGVVVTGDDLRAMPPRVRTALWGFVECGGSLVVVGSGRVPAGWQRLRTEAQDTWSVYQGGFGECVVSGDEKPDQWPLLLWRRVVAFWGKKVPPLQVVRTMTEANRAFPVVDNISVPVRGLFVLMVVFALAIGPVNFYVLARLKRRLWLLWTVPAVSLVTCGIVFGYMFLVEGWQGHVRVEGLTILDERSGRATTIGWVGVYSPLTPGDGLHFSRASELTPQLASNRGFSGGGGVPARVIDWTDDQHLAAGWVSARVPAHFMLRKNEPRAERVTVRRDPDGSLTLVNGLGADIHQLWLADARGRIYRAADVPAGGKGVLKRVGGKAAGDAGTLRGLFESDWTTLYQRVTLGPGQFLRPGCYLAVLESAPFIEEALAGARRQARSLVYGLMKGPAHAD